VFSPIAYSFATGLAAKKGPAHPSKAVEQTCVRLTALPSCRREDHPVMVRKPWSFKEDRRLMELAKSSTSLQEAAKQLGRSPQAIKRMALRLGLSLKAKTGKTG
jgi:hypothetical protein